MLAALKLALSRTIDVVASEMALLWPPMTPARAIGPLASAMTIFEESRTYSFSSSATKVSVVTRGTGEDRIAVEFFAVERMHWLREFGHDVVREIDDVVDRVESD